MILQLTGNTVTQAMKRLRKTLTECPDPELIVKTDNEAVKLNLYNLVHKLGYRCKTERDGQHHKLLIKLGSRKHQPERAQVGGVPVAENIGRLAFPVAHVSQGENVVARPPRARSKAVRPTAPVQAPPAQLKEEKLPEPVPQAPPPFKKLPEPVPQAPPPFKKDSRCWLILQSDQVGSRDSRLGFELLEDLVSHLSTEHYEGIFLVHRAVFLLDPAFQGGRGLRVLLRKNLPILACEKSIAFYNLADKVASPASIAPFHQVSELGRHHKLVWI